MKPYPTDTELIKKYWEGQRFIEKMALEYIDDFMKEDIRKKIQNACLLYTSPSPRD